MNNLEKEQQLAQKVYAAAIESGLITEDDTSPSLPSTVEIERLNLLGNALISSKLFEDDEFKLHTILDEYSSIIKFRFILNRLLAQE